jgi:hypothetical protein
MMMMSVTTECAIPASNTNGFQTLKGEHQVRYDDGMTPDQTITDGAEPNSKLTAKMSVPGLCVQLVSATPLVVYRLAFRSPRSFADVD